MTKILFIRRPHVYLPEIAAYKSYLAKHHPLVKTFESTNLDKFDPMDYDVVWHFMGQDMKGDGRYVVHEYNSLSTPPFVFLKNQVKKLINIKPDKRIFLNKTVFDVFSFKDDTPHCLRDMGVDEDFFQTKPAACPSYDFIYAGGLNRGDIIIQTLEHFANNMSDASIVLVGDAPKPLKARFKGNKNIIFKGRVPYSEVPILMSNARYGLNIMPDIKPFNIQTATKVLEYAAIGLPIVTTSYKWINDFEANNKSAFFKIKPDLSNLSLKELDEFTFITPNIEELSWDNIIKKSNIFSFLENIACPI